MEMKYTITLRSGSTTVTHEDVAGCVVERRVLQTCEAMRFTSNGNDLEITVRLGAKAGTRKIVAMELYHSRDPRICVSHHVFSLLREIEA